MWLPFLLATRAWAAYPENVDLPSMTDFDGELVFDTDILANSYEQLVKELGTLVANKASTPAASLGVYGFDVDFSTQFVLTEARYRAGQVSPWARASVDETAPPYRLLPTLTIRKGLPLSTEVGASFGWISGTTTGTFGAFGRVAVLQGYRPLPDVSLKVGYSGYVGNDQLDVGALDLGLTIGTSIPIGRFEAVNTGKVSPFVSFTTLRITANPTIDPELEQSLGAVRFTQPVFGSTDVIEPPRTLEMFGAGVQVLAGVTHLQLAAMWAPSSIPTVTTSIGFTY